MSYSPSEDDYLESGKAVAEYGGESRHKEQQQKAATPLPQGNNSTRHEIDFPARPDHKKQAEPSLPLNLYPRPDLEKPSVLSPRHRPNNFLSSDHQIPKQPDSKQKANYGDEHKQPPPKPEHHTAAPKVNRPPQPPTPASIAEPSVAPKMKPRPQPPIPASKPEPPDAPKVKPQPQPPIPSSKPEPPDAPKVKPWPQPPIPASKPEPPAAPTVDPPPQPPIPASKPEPPSAPTVDPPPQPPIPASKPEPPAAPTVDPPSQPPEGYPPIRPLTSPSKLEPRPKKGWLKKIFCCCC